MATIKKTYTLVNANTPKAMRLQGIGWVKGTEAGSLQVGDSIVWNYGEVSVVVSISETEKMIKVTTNSGNMRSFAKSRLLCIAKTKPTAEPAPIAQPEQAAPVAQPEQAAPVAQPEQAAPVAQAVEQTVQAAELAPVAQPEQKTASKQKISFKSNGSAQEYSIQVGAQSCGQILKFRGFYVVEFDHYERAENVQNKTATLNEAKALVRDFFAAIEAIATAAPVVQSAPVAQPEQGAAAEPALELTFENMQSTELGTEAEQLAAKKLGYSRTPHFYEKTGENFIANGDAETGADLLLLARCMRSRIAEAAEQEAAREAQQVAEHYAQEAQLAEVFAKAADEFGATACGTYYAAEGTYTVSPAQGAHLSICLDGEPLGRALPNIRIQQQYATKKQTPVLDGFYAYDADGAPLGLCYDIFTACVLAYEESPAEPSASAQRSSSTAQAAPLFWEFAARVLLHVAENDAQHPLAEIAEFILDNKTERDAHPQNKLYKKIIAYAYEHLDEHLDAPLYYLLETLRRCMSRYYTPAASLALLYSQAQRIVGERTAQTLQQQCLRRLRTAQAQ